MAVSSVFVVKIAGSALPDDVELLLTAALVQTDRHLPAAFNLRLRDPDRVVVARTNARIGAPVTISVLPGGSGAAQQLFDGEITALEAEFDRTGSFTVIRGHDRSARMHHGRRTQGWTQATAADVATAIARRNGLTPGRVESNGTVYDHLCQTGTSDFQFLTDLAEQIGHEFAVSGGKLDFAPPPPAAAAPAAAGADNNPLVLRPGAGLLRVRATVTGSEQVTGVQARGWDVATKQALVATAPAATTGAVLGADTAGKFSAALGGADHVTADIPWGTQAEVTAAAKAVADRIAGSFARLEAVAQGSPALDAGVAVTLDGLGQPFDGKYTITAAGHRYDRTLGYTTTITVTGRQERSLLGLTGTSTRPRSAPGVVIATVTDAKDPQHQGRVKLAFPWLSADYVSDWTRTVQPGAGKQRGATVVPEVGDEVLVAFDRGDTRRPFVIGGLFNGVDTPDPAPIPLVEDATGAINRRTWISRLGHRIDLLDQDGKTEGITLSTKGNKLELQLDAVNTKVTLHSDGTLVVEGAKGVTVDAGQNTLSLKGKQISLTAAAGGVKVDGGQGGVTVDGGTGAVKVTASAAQLELKGLTATLEGSTQTTVKAGAECSVTAALVKIN